MDFSEQKTAPGGPSFGGRGLLEGLRLPGGRRRGGGGRGAAPGLGQDGQSFGEQTRDKDVEQKHRNVVS